MSRQIQMVDLAGQYKRIKKQVLAEISETLDSTSFINGPQVKRFQENLETYLGGGHVITCANGTDSLQIALMALGLKAGDEVIVPAFTYVATAEVIALLGLTPVMIDVDPNTFNVTAQLVAKAITHRTKVIVPVHLFGQSTDMDEIMELANKNNIIVIEDNAQAIGADYTNKNKQKVKTGMIGHIGSTSFFPSKNLGCYGDGGALTTNDSEMASKLRMIANHGQAKKYHHQVVGVNSRLDSLQAGILDVKLRHLDKYCRARQRVASAYNKAFKAISQLRTPRKLGKSSHVYHQYTLRVTDGRRDELQAFLQTKGIPSMIYYPIPLYKQAAFRTYVPEHFTLPVTEMLCKEVLSLPIHTEMDKETLGFIIEQVKAFFN
jgi:UDP-2-acetamido-2-deoxy-ribo-hexuluronate aminotransferase